MQLVRPIGTFILHTAYITNSRELFFNKSSHNRNPFDRGPQFQTYSQLPSSSSVLLESIGDSDLPSILSVKLRPSKVSAKSKINLDNLNNINNTNNTNISNTNINTNNISSNAMGMNTDASCINATNANYMNNATFFTYEDYYAGFLDSQVGDRADGEVNDQGSYYRSDDYLSPPKYDEYKRLKKECSMLKQQLKKKESMLGKGNYREIKKKKVYKPIEVRVGIRIQEADLFNKCKFFMKKAKKGYPLIFYIKTDGQADEYELAAEGIFNKAKEFLQEACTTSGKMNISKSQISMYFKPINTPNKEKEDNSRESIIETEDYYIEDNNNNNKDNKTNNRDRDNINNYNTDKDNNNTNKDINNNNNNNKDTNISNKEIPNDNLNQYRNPNDYDRSGYYNSGYMNQGHSNNNNMGDQNYYGNNYYHQNNPNKGYQHNDNTNRNQYNTMGMNTNTSNINSSNTMGMNTIGMNTMGMNINNSNTSNSNMMNKVNQSNIKHKTAISTPSRLLDQSKTKDTDSRWIVKNKPSDQANQVSKDSQGQLIAELSSSTGQQNPKLNIGNSRNINTINTNTNTNINTNNTNIRDNTNNSKSNNSTNKATGNSKKVGSEPLPIGSGSSSKWKVLNKKI